MTPKCQEPSAGAASHPPQTWTSRFHPGIRGRVGRGEECLPLKLPLASKFYISLTEKFLFNLERDRLANDF